MNRHHFSVYIRNCHLVMLLRQEPTPDVDLNVFKPAEWRWKLPQVCDGAWHHYAISVDFPQVSLAIDTVTVDDVMHWLRRVSVLNE